MMFIIVMIGKKTMSFFTCMVLDFRMIMMAHYLPKYVLMQ